MSNQRNKKRTGSAFDLGGLDSNAQPTKLVAIDPGTVHNGVGLFICPIAGTTSWHLSSLADMEPVKAIAFLQSWLAESRLGGECVQVVVEGYQLYPNMLQQQGMSRMGTPEVIGALKWVYYSSATAGGQHRFQEQGASVKAAGIRYMEESGIEVTGTNPHKRDAESHGWYRIKLLRAEANKRAKLETP